MKLFRRRACLLRALFPRFLRRLLVRCSQLSSRLRSRLRSQLHNDLLLEGIENSVGDVVVRVELHLDGSAGCTPSLVPQFLLHNSE